MADYPVLPEMLTRFLTQSDHFSKDNRRVKERAFLPPNDLKLSVFQIDGVDNDGIWSLYTLLPLYGRGDFLSSAATNIGLRVEPDNDPPRHANIVGWPPDKSARKSLAQSIAAEATLILRTENG